ncbi:transcription initiation factor IIF subunit beta-like protein, partial [Trifolium pratense]
MEEEKSYGGSSSGSNLETSKAERSVWLMKCPVAVAKSWQNHPPSQPLSKVVFSIDPLLPEHDPAHLQVDFNSMFLSTSLIINVE